MRRANRSSQALRPLILILLPSAPLAEYSATLACDTRDIATFQYCPAEQATWRSRATGLYQQGGRTGGAHCGRPDPVGRSGRAGSPRAGDGLRHCAGGILPLRSAAAFQRRDGFKDRGESRSRAAVDAVPKLGQAVADNPRHRVASRARPANVTYTMPVQGMELSYGIRRRSAGMWRMWIEPGSEALIRLGLNNVRAAQWFSPFPRVTSSGPRFDRMGLLAQSKTRARDSKPKGQPRLRASRTGRERPLCRSVRSGSNQPARKIAGNPGASLR